MRRLGAVSVVSACAAATFGCSAASPSAHVGHPVRPPRVTIQGEVNLDFGPVGESNWEKINSLQCKGIDGFDDLQAGGEVTVLDPGGKVIGLGSLTYGIHDQRTCSFGFTIRNLPRVPFYGVEVTHRGVLHYSLADVTGQTIAMSIG